MFAGFLAPQSGSVERRRSLANSCATSASGSYVGAVIIAA
jgi:hypothetical protein